MSSILHQPRITPPNVEVRPISLPKIFLENVGYVFPPGPIVIIGTASKRKYTIKQGIIIPGPLPPPVPGPVGNSLSLLNVSEDEMLVQLDYMTGTELETGYGYLIRYRFADKEYDIIDKHPLMEPYFPTIFWQPIYFDGSEYILAKYDYFYHELSACRTIKSRLVCFEVLATMGQNYTPLLISSRDFNTVCFSENKCVSDNVLGYNELFLQNINDPNDIKTILLNEKFQRIKEYDIPPFMFIGENIVRYRDIIWDMENDVYYKLYNYNTVGPSIMYWDKEVNKLLGVAYYEPGNSAMADPNDIRSGSGTKEDPYVISYDISINPERLTGVKLDNRFTVSYSRHLIETPNMWAEGTYHVLRTISYEFIVRRYMFKNRINTEDVLQKSSGGELSGGAISTLSIAYGTTIVSIKTGPLSIMKIARVG